MKSIFHFILTVGLFVAFLPSPQAQEGQITTQYKEAADKIITAAMNNEGAWQKLQYLCDIIGPRLSGSESLNQAIHWVAEQMKADGLQNVRLQPVMVTHWVRSDESATLIAPREVKLNMLGLGGSIGTPPKGITADVIVVPGFKTFMDLTEDDIKGKIVLFNAPFTTYGDTVQYRSQSANTAAKKGAVAALIRSVGRRSLQNPHTGTMSAYEDGVPKIPAAALSIEDAMMIARIAESGVTPRLHLTMEAQWLPDAQSYNVIGEIPGRENPDEIVVMGGHIDSWDVGQGAHDDGGGCMIAMEALKLLLDLGLQPRRTLRVVLWTNEENGTLGAKEYFRSEQDKLKNYVAAIESDTGMETAWGFGFSLNKQGAANPAQDEATAMKTVEEIGALLQSVQAQQIRPGGFGVDIAPFINAGVPGFSLENHRELYWDIHHTHADTLDKIDPKSLQINLAAMAVMGYVLADMDICLDQLPE